MFQQRNIGEIFYLDDIQNIIREYPMEIIRKELIDWWNHKFAGLNREDVDSYLYYSQILDMIKKDYRVLYDEGGQLRRKEQPSSTYLGLEKWLRDNRNRVFGLRKVEIFKRFIPGTILE